MFSLCVSATHGLLLGPEKMWDTTETYRFQKMSIGTDTMRNYRRVATPAEPKGKTCNLIAVKGRDSN